ncbi:MAG: DUF5596 domain-containing protein, partial [Acidobacteria bacterium]|nr:DUF5596 domain-containing protein [Acidobacteriota bacterium]
PTEILRLSGIQAPDRQECLDLLSGAPSSNVARRLDVLQQRLAGIQSGLPADSPDDGGTESDWISAYLRFSPQIIHWHHQHDIPAAVSEATLGDLGLQIAIHRRVHGSFGLDTWPWLGSHYRGALYRLGRLQFLLHQESARIPGALPGEWVAGVHIPEDGALNPAVIDESLAAAGEFFATYFPDRAIRFADCESWLLDPYLREQLDPASNISRFAYRFTPSGEPTDQPADAVYFTFRTRTLDQLDLLPRDTALQRVVLDRIADGGVWQLGYGYLPLER